MAENLEKIIKGCAQEKRSAQEQLYKLFAKKLFAVSLLYTKDHSAAEDVLHEGFIKIFQNIKDYANKGSFEGWLRKIIINTALQRYRKQKYLYSITDETEFDEEFSNDDVVSEISANDLMNFIQELSPQYRVVFSLYAIEGYSHKEISEIVSITESTSKSNLSRARKILQEKVLANFPAMSKKSYVG